MPKKADSLKNNKNKIKFGGEGVELEKKQHKKEDSMLQNLALKLMEKELLILNIASILK